MKFRIRITVDEPRLKALGIVRGAEYVAEKEIRAFRPRCDLHAMIITSRDGERQERIFPREYEILGRVTS